MRWLPLCLALALTACSPVFRQAMPETPTPRPTTSSFDAIHELQEHEDSKGWRIVAYWPEAGHQEEWTFQWRSDGRQYRLYVLDRVTVLLEESP